MDAGKRLQAPEIGLTEDQLSGPGIGIKNNSSFQLAPRIYSQR
jgi:hypothetical protein